MMQGKAAHVKVGTCFVVRQSAPVFESPESWTISRTIAAGDWVVADGPSRIVEGYSMVPIKPGGAVELKMLSEAPNNNEMLTVEAPVPRLSDQQIRNARLVAEKIFKAQSRVYQHRKNVLLPAMQRLDKHFTMHWAGVNSAKTGTAGLSIAAFVCVLIPPAIPVGIGLGIGAAALGGATSVGDAIADSDKAQRLDSLVQKDEELLQTLGHAVEEVKSLTQNLTSDETSLLWKLALSSELKLARSSLQTGYSISSQIRSLVDISMIAKGIRAGAISGAKAVGGYEVAAVTTSAGSLGARATMAASSKAFAAVGMAFSVADCASSWYNGKEGQMKLRKCMEQTESYLREYEKKWNRG